MISTRAALGILDGIFLAASMLAFLVIAGCPTEWLLALTDLSLHEMPWLALVIVLAAPWLIHAIAMSERVRAMDFD